jgi:hypothetical protein
MTNQLCLQQQCDRLYRKLLQQLSFSKATLTDEKKWIEWAFSLTTKMWFGIQQEAAGYLFYDQQEEITFYKVFKPRFEGLMDYFTHLYKSVLFQPEELSAKKEYWGHELDLCKNFLLKHRSFCRYYEQGKTSMDPVYFAQENNKQSLVLGANDNNRFSAGAVITSYSYLLARVISIKKYQTYILEKICFLTRSRPN